MNILAYHSLFHIQPLQGCGIGLISNCIIQSGALVENLVPGRRLERGCSPNSTAKRLTIIHVLQPFYFQAIFKD